MIKTEIIDEKFIRTYSDSGFYIHGGSPEADYAEATDPIDSARSYVETDRPIETEETDEADVSDYQEALKELGVE